MKALNKLTFLALAAIFISGCKKDLDSNTHSAATLQASKPDSTQDMIPTPGGLIPKANVHLIEPGYHLTVSSGHVLKIHDRTGKIMEDFGVVKQSGINNQNAQQNNLKAKNYSVIPGALPSVNPNWQTWAQWNNTSGQPITSFSTTWVVPSAPPSNDSQVIYLFNGLEEQDQVSIMQPVLQWGSNHLFGGNSWVISNWYVWGSGGAYTTSVPVTPGTSLTGVINYTGETNGSYNYTSSFAGYTNTMNITDGNQYTGGTIPQVLLQTWAVETLEVYHWTGSNTLAPEVVQSTDYPNDLDVVMKNISLQTNGSAAPLVWTSQIGQYAVVGEHTNVISNNSSGTGEVDIYFHKQPPVIAYTTPDVYQTGALIYPLSPTNTGGAATSYAVSPALPAGLSLNTSTGVISGTPTTVVAAANYTITATNSSGHGTFVINLTVNAAPAPIAYDFQVTTTGSSSSFFTLVVNGVNVSGTVPTAGYNVVKNINSTISPNPNSTVVLTIDQGYMPTSAMLNTYLTGVHGIINGYTITFPGVNIAAKAPSLSIVLH
jgi:hypothetical protein